MYTQDTINLLCEIERTPSLNQCMELGYQLLGNALFFQDIESSVPYYTRSVSISDSDWAAGISDNALPNSQLCGENGLEYIFRLAQKTSDPVFLPPNPSGQTTGSLAYPLVAGSTKLGVLILTSHLRPIDREHDTPLFSLFGNIFLRKLQHEISLGAGRKNITESMLLRLLDGRPCSDAYIQERLKHIAWKPEKNMWLLMISASSAATRTGVPLQELIDLLTSRVQNKLLRYKNSFLYIVTGKEPVLCLERECPELTAFLDRYELNAAVSLRFHKLNDLQSSYQQACQTMKLGSALNPQDRIHFFEEIAPYCLIDVWKDCGLPLDTLIAPEIGLLAQFDRENNTGLTDTLITYLQCGMNINRTAEALFVHSNTVRYRLQRCEELLGSGFLEGGKLFRYLLSSAVLRFQEFTNNIGV